MDSSRVGPPSIYDITDPQVGAATVNQLAQDLQDSAMPAGKPN